MTKRDCSNVFKKIIGTLAILFFFPSFSFSQTIELEPIVIKKAIEYAVTEDLEYVYPSGAEEFVLSVISVRKEGAYRSRESRGVEILFCARGSATIKSAIGEAPVVLNQGASVLVPAAAGMYDIQGEATIYKATVPI